MIGVAWGIDRSITGMADTQGRRPHVVDVKAAAAELIGMLLFVVVGCGTACAHGAGDGETRLIVALAFGMAILVLAYSVGHHSGGHLNCAVTFSLVLGGQVPWYQGITNLLAQLVGSVMGAGLLAVMFPCDQDLTATLGTNIINPAYSVHRVLVSEAFGTFLLCFTVWETAVTPQASCGKNACIAIGFAVFLAHVLLLPVDGCSINPTRSFGPAIVSHFRGCANYTEGGIDDLWVMWVGPLVGAALAAIVQLPFAPANKGKSEEQQILKNQQENILASETILPMLPTKETAADLKMQSGNRQQREKSKLASETFLSVQNAAIALEIELDRRDHEVLPTCSAHVAPATLPSPPLDEVISLPDLQLELLEGAKPHRAGEVDEPRVSPDAGSPSVLGAGRHPESGRTEEPSSSLALEDVGDAHATRAKGRRSLPSDLPPSILARIRLPADLPPKRLKLAASAPCLGVRLEDAEHSSTPAGMQEASVTA
mmetsp:Transcript_14755/g.37459  ORF Transcript_14755/g.37459 Transcript_14755/m.37459 type:complete len:485 (+) Transcript_14755:80-1534(+)